MWRLSQREKLIQRSGWFGWNMTTHWTLDWLPESIPICGPAHLHGPGKPQIAGRTSFYFLGAWQYLINNMFWIWRFGDVLGVHMPKVWLCLTCVFTDPNGSNTRSPQRQKLALRPGVEIGGFSILLEEAVIEAGTELRFTASFFGSLSLSLKLSWNWDSRIWVCLKGTPILGGSSSVYPRESR